MKVFISSAGDSGREIAQAIYKWIPLVLHFVKPFYSKEIEKGAQWPEVLSKELETTNYGIICLTEESVASRWIHYEAGALAKLRENSRVSSILFGENSTPTSGPLQHFQQTSFNEEDMLRLVVNINKYGGEDTRRDDLKELFSELWPSLQSKIKAALQRMEKPKPAPTTLEDLAALVQRQIQSSAAASDQIAQKVLAAMGPRASGDLPDLNYSPWKNIYKRWPTLVKLVEEAGDEVDQETWDETKAVVEKLMIPMENLLRRMEKNAAVPKKKPLSDDDVDDS